MTTKEYKRLRKAYRHFITDQVLGSNGNRRAVSRRWRAQYFESFPVQQRRMVIGV